MIWHLPGIVSWSASLPQLQRFKSLKSSPSVKLGEIIAQTASIIIYISRHGRPTKKTCLSTEVALFLIKRFEKSFVPPFIKMWWHWISWQHWAGLFPVPKSGSVKFISFPAHYQCPSRRCLRKAIGRQIHPSGLWFSKDFWMHLSKLTHQCSCPEKDQMVPKPSAKSGW